VLRFLAAQRKCGVHNLDFTDIAPDQVIAFLGHLEAVRKNGVTTRNVRLAAIHAFCRYVGTYHPEHLDQVQRILGIPFKRARQRVVEYLEHAEIEAALSRINRASRDGRRDYALLATIFNTGARVQEIVDLRARDLQLIRPFQIRLFGKGRKERFCRLWPQTAHLLRDHCNERHLDLRSDARVFLNHREEPLTRFGVRYILAKHLNRARAEVGTLRCKRLHPHSMRTARLLLFSLQVSILARSASGWDSQSQYDKPIRNNRSRNEAPCNCQGQTRWPSQRPFLAAKSVRSGVAGESLTRSVM